MVKQLIVIGLFIFSFCANAQKNGQTFVSAPLTDSSVALTNTQWLNQKYIYGRYSSGYGPVEKMKLGSMFTVAGDSLTVTASGTGNVNQLGNSFGAIMKIGTTDNFQFRFLTNNVERFTITSGATTGGLLVSSQVTSKTNLPEEVIAYNLTSTGTAAAGFGVQYKHTAPNASGVIKDLGVIKNTWKSATNGAEISKWEFQNDSFGTMYTVLSLDGPNSISISPNSTPVTINTTTFTPSSNYNIGNAALNMTVSSSKTSDATAVKIDASGQGSGTTINNATVSTGNPTASTILTLGGSVTATGAGSNSFIGLTISNTINQIAGLHTGISRGIYINQSLSGAYDNRALEISNNGGGKGIYQTGSTLLNCFVGKVGIGTTGTPTVDLQMMSGRFAQRLVAIASANNLDLGTDGNIFRLTSTTSIVKILTTYIPAGTVITLIFSGVTLVTHNGATGAGAPMFLAGSTNYTTTNNSTLTLVYDGTQWQELSRKQP